MAPRPHPLVAAIRPVVDALGATIVPVGKLADGDIPLEWEGEVVAGVRPPDLADALPALIARIEADFGGRLADLSRVDKQRAVRILEERGRRHGRQPHHRLQLPERHAECLRSPDPGPRSILFTPASSVVGTVAFR